MSDLISRSTLVEELQKYFVNNSIHKNDLAEVIANQPTVESNPVVHGDWKQEIMNYFCSQCKKAFDDDLAWITGEFKLPNFCPECGADMRKKVE